MYPEDVSTLSNNAAAASDNSLQAEPAHCGERKSTSCHGRECRRRQGCRPQLRRQRQAAREAEGVDPPQRHSAGAGQRSGPAGDTRSLKEQFLAPLQIPRSRSIAGCCDEPARGARCRS